MKKNPAQPAAADQIATHGASARTGKRAEALREETEAAWEQVQTLLRICSLRAAAEFEDMARGCRG